MQNVTISLDEQTLRLTEAEAQKAGKSLSDFISEFVAQEIVRSWSAEDQDNPQLAALRRLFQGPLLPLSENGRMPSSEERNARR